MFRKEIIFGLFEMIQQKKRKKKVRTASLGPSPVGYGGKGLHKENQRFCAILHGCLISFFDGNFKIHYIKMYLSIEGPR